MGTHDKAMRSPVAGTMKEDPNLILEAGGLRLVSISLANIGGQSDTTRELPTEALSHALHLGGNQVAPLPPSPHLGISRVALVERRWRILFVSSIALEAFFSPPPSLSPFSSSAWRPLRDMGRGRHSTSLYCWRPPPLSLCRQRMDGPPGIRTGLKGAAEEIWKGSSG